MRKETVYILNLDTGEDLKHETRDSIGRDTKLSIAFVI